MRLTAHELRVFAYLMHHRGRVVPQAELAEHIYARTTIATRTPSRSSSPGCAASSAPRTIETVRGLGYRAGPGA